MPWGLTIIWRLAAPLRVRYGKFYCTNNHNSIMGVTFLLYIEMITYSGVTLGLVRYHDHEWMEVMCRFWFRQALISQVCTSSMKFSNSGYIVLIAVHSVQMVLHGIG